MTRMPGCIWASQAVKADRQKCQRELAYAKRKHVEAYVTCAWKDNCHCKDNKPT